MLHGKLLACVLLGSMGVAAAAPAARHWGEGRLAHSPIGKLVSGHIGRLLVLRSELNLTDEQRNKMREAVMSHKGEIAQAAKTVWEKRVALRSAVLSNQTDEAAIRQAADELGKAAGDAAVLAARVAAEVRPVLTSDQQEKIGECIAQCQAATEAFFEKAAAGN
ncbi:MAG: Spy/CpxP family protein refolding chaperone [Planctomycetota bacterium]